MPLAAQGHENEAGFPERADIINFIPFGLRISDV